MTLDKSRKLAQVTLFFIMTSRFSAILFAFGQYARHIYHGWPADHVTHQECQRTMTSCVFLENSNFNRGLHGHDRMEVGHIQLVHTTIKDVH